MCLSEGFFQHAVFKIVASLFLHPYTADPESMAGLSVKVRLLFVLPGDGV